MNQEHDMMASPTGASPTPRAGDDDALSSKFKEALGIIWQKKGQLSDDTYLEKLASETAKRLSTANDPDECYESWGLRHFVQEALQGSTGSDCNNSLLDFGLKILSRCFHAAKSVREQARDICGNLLSPSHHDRAKAMRTTSGLHLLQKLLLFHGSGWAFQVDLLRVVLIPAWNEASRATSLFWTRALEELSKSHIHCVLQGEDNGSAADTLAEIIRLAQSTQKVKVVVAEVLRDVVEQSSEKGDADTADRRRVLLAAQLGREASSSSSGGLERDAAGVDSATAECAVLSLVLSDPKLAAKKLSLDLAAWEGDGRAEALLRTANFLFRDRRRVETFLPVADTLLGTVRKDLEGRDGCGRTFTIIKRARRVLLSCASTENPTAGDVVETVRALISSFLLKDCSCAGGSGHEVELPSRLLQLAVELYQDFQPSRRKFTEDWTLFSSLALQRNVDDQTTTLLLKSLEKFLGEHDKCTSLETLLEPLWKLAKSHHWAVEDAFMQLLISAIRSPKLSAPATGLNLIQNVAVSCTGDANSFLRSTAFDLLSAMASSKPELLTLTRSDIDSLIRHSLLNETEAVVRRSSARFASIYYCNHDQLSDVAKDSLIKGLLDLDSDTKETLLAFWADLVRSKLVNLPPRQDVAKMLEEERITDALCLATQDFDKRFLLKLDEVLVSIGDKLEEIFNGEEPRPKVAKMTSDIPTTDGNKEEITDSINQDRVLSEIVVTKDSSLLRTRTGSQSTEGPEDVRKLRFTFDELGEALAGWKRSNSGPFQDKIEEFCELQMGLDSVLSDIIQSVSPENEIDGLDCV